MNYCAVLSVFISNRVIADETNKLTRIKNWSYNLKFNFTTLVYEYISSRNNDGSLFFIINFQTRRSPLP